MYYQHTLLIALTYPCIITPLNALHHLPSSSGIGPYRSLAEGMFRGIGEDTEEWGGSGSGSGPRFYQ